MTNYDKIFNLCVILLDWMALKFDTTYIKINVWIFCIIGPIIFLSMFLLIIILIFKIKNLQQLKIK